MRTLSSQSGAVLIMVLWVLAVLAMVGTYYALDARVQRNLCQQQWDDLAGRTAVRSLLVFLSTRIAAAGMPEEDAWDEGLFVPDGRGYELDFGGRVVRFRLEDEKGKLDLNKAGEGQLRAVARGLFKDRDIEFADTIVDSILDWRDTDRLSRIHGAEDSTYQERLPPYRAANGPFRLLEELLLVNGVTQDAFFGPIQWRPDGSGEDAPPAWEGGLLDLFTVYNGTNTLLQEAAPEPLRTLLPGDLRASAAGAHVYRLVVSWGTRRYMVFWSPGRGREGNFRLIHWTEMLSSTN